MPQVVQNCSGTTTNTLLFAHIYTQIHKYTNTFKHSNRIRPTILPEQRVRKGAWKWKQKNEKERNGKAERIWENGKKLSKQCSKRKVKASNHISFALVSFSCVYVRFASPRPSLRQRINFGLYVGACISHSSVYIFCVLCVYLWMCGVLACSSRVEIEKEKIRAYKPIYKHFHNGFWFTHNTHKYIVYMKREEKEKANSRKYSYIWHHCMQLFCMHSHSSDHHACALCVFLYIYM